jgi:hypothetical protein
VVDLSVGSRDPAQGSERTRRYAGVSRTPPSANPLPQRGLRCGRDNNVGSKPPQATTIRSLPRFATGPRLPAVGSAGRLAAPYQFCRWVLERRSCVPRRHPTRSVLGWQGGMRDWSGGAGYAALTQPRSQMRIVVVLCAYWPISVQGFRRSAGAGAGPRLGWWAATGARWTTRARKNARVTLERWRRIVWGVR